MNPVADRQLRLGLAFLLLLGAVVTAAVLQYRGAFRSTIPVTVQADRAGLTMDVSAPVKFRGVQVGRVRSISAHDGKVDIGLAIDKDAVKDVPGGLTAQLVPPTAFGARYVQLTANGHGSGPIAPDQQISADHVTVEVDEAFTHLTDVLDAARPSDVNNALAAVAGAVDQRGRRIGSLIDRSDRYLRLLHPSLETLASDVRRSDDVVTGYDQAMPDLLRTFGNVTKTSDTLVARHERLRATARALSAFSNDTRGLVLAAEAGLGSTLAMLAPVTALLERYAPELPCLVGGLAGANGLAEKAVGGTNPGVTTITRIAPGAEPYRYPRNLPVVGDHRGPGCYGLPYVDPAEARQPSPTFVSGANPHAGPGTTPQQDVSTTLFGALAGLVTGR
ncbi:virulence factor Mce family protein [Nocardioides phosphati]|uniref:Virulence factor Mce family protein n=1 Tax=Nocardioides phosphati TaxID=1867775 RepID=A0ABQ2N801_9ACTN|nr:MCE family protein [Nocardioides phosphati]GGO86106.1 virulence factor Mce family protein [Nocardioides phosphati]